MQPLTLFAGDLTPEVVEAAVRMGAVVAGCVVAAVLVSEAVDCGKRLATAFVAVLHADATHTLARAERARRTPQRKPRPKAVLVAEELPSPPGEPHPPGGPPRVTESQEC